MFRFVIASMLMSVGLFVGGCGSQEGDTVFTAGPNSQEAGGKAPFAGTYMLFTAMSPNPTTTIKLSEGDPVGFRKGANDQIEAFAKDQTHLLPKGTSQAYWKVVK